MALLTLFTTPKPFQDSHVITIQRNALKSWKALGDEVEIVFIGDEYGMPEIAREFGLIHRPDVLVNELGTPLISSIFDIGRAENDSPFLAYVNTDIILFPDFLEALKKVSTQLSKFLLVGQRYDLDITEELAFEPGWQAELLKKAQTEGKRHARAGSDYFVFPRACFQDIPDFRVGRAGWDNWMIYKARREKWASVDCSADIDIIHQNHDYSHLPGGQTHYRQPETGVNIRLAGGRRTIFDLDDCAKRLENGKLLPMPHSRARLKRELVHWPLLNLGFYGASQALFKLLNPEQAKRELERQKEMDAAMEMQKKALREKQNEGVR
jgi:hypothetical protein